MSPASNPQFKNKAGFTLIELLIVIAVIGILSGIIMVSFDGAKDKARIAKSKSFSSSVQNSLFGNQISEWRFDEGSGTVAVDTVGSNDGTLVGGPAWKSVADCISGGCLQFSGTPVQYVNSPGPVAVPEDGTIEAWIKGFAASQKNENIYPLGFDYVSLLGPSAMSDSRAGIITGVSGNYDYLDWGAQNLYNGSWHHYVVTWTKDGTNYNFYLYIDGKKIGSPKVSTKHPAGSLRNIKVGVAWGTYGAHTGLIDEVCIYGAALTTSFIRSQYLAGIEGLLARGQITNQDYQQRIAELNSNHVARK